MMKIKNYWLKFRINQIFQELAQYAKCQNHNINHNNNKIRLIHFINFFNKEVQYKKIYIYLRTNLFTNPRLALH